MKAFDSFPKPLGSYTVGRTQMDFTYTGADGTERELTALFFYPADSDEGKPTAEYIFPESIDMVQETIQQLGEHPPDALFSPAVKTCCYDDLALSAKQERYPVVLHICGASGFPNNATVNCGDLASSGYIAISIGCPGSTAFRLSDGRISPVSQKFKDDMLESSFDPELMEAAPLLMEGRLEEKEAIALCRKIYSSAGASGFVKYVKAQADDAGYVADCLGRMDSGELESMFKGRLQLDIGLGIFGHSLGASSTAIALRDDERFTCGVLHDGAAMGALEGDLGKPVLELCAPISYNLAAIFGEANTKDFYLYIIDNSAHHDYCDFLFTSVIEFLKSSWDPMVIRNIISTYTIAFFDQYLLGKDVDVGSIVFDDVEMIKKLVD